MARIRSVEDTWTCGLGEVCAFPPRLTPLCSEDGDAAKGGGKYGASRGEGGVAASKTAFLLTVVLCQFDNKVLDYFW